MKLTLAYCSPRGRARQGEAETWAQEYIGRAGRMNAVSMIGFPSERALLEAAAPAPGRPAARLLLFDAGGELLGSEAFAALVGTMRDEGVPRVMLAVGPADGWSTEARARATRVLSLGRITLPHELARVVVAEQIYRALTILSGHPYHCGH